MADWSSWDWGGDDNEDDTELQPGGGYIPTKDCLILLIDASYSMFVKDEGKTEIPFELCVKCAKSVLLNKIVSSEKDLIGVVFFGTREDKNPSNFKNVYIYQDLDMPDAPRIKQLEEMLEDDGFQNFDQEYGHSDDYSLNNVFWTCSIMLSTSGSKLSHKRILLFTNNDDPHKNDVSLKLQAKTKAKVINIMAASD
jgi:ATP-dependent DNA helicase 2 subunit 1